MRQVYNRSFTATLVSGGSRYVFSEKVASGMVLHVHSCFAYAPERLANDHISIGLRNGGEDVVLQAQATLAQQLGASTQCGFFVGENDQVFGYFSDADDGNHISINLNGVLIPLPEWTKEAE
jgi:hypothetical protein